MTTIGVRFPTTPGWSVSVPDFDMVDDAEATKRGPVTRQDGAAARLQTRAVIAQAFKW